MSNFALSFNMFCDMTDQISAYYLIVINIMTFLVYGIGLHFSILCKNDRYIGD